MERRAALRKNRKSAVIIMLSTDRIFDAGNFFIYRECINAIKSLRSNSKTLITKPDKRSGLVMLKKTDLIKKINSILEDKTKFLHSALEAKRTTLQRLNPEYNAACCSCTKTICFLQIYTITFDRLALSGRACTAFPKHTRKMCHSDPSCL